MPELPEVETIRRGLEPHLVGLTLRSLTVTDQKILDVSAREGRLASLEGQRIQTLTRRGKYLVIVLDRHYLIIHLGMTGQLTLHDPRLSHPKSLEPGVTGPEWCERHAPDRHTHVHILLGNGCQLLFRDTRKFGRIYLLECTSEQLLAFFKKHHLGLEPFTPDYHLKAFLAAFKNRHLRLKSLLLNQAFVAGVGNIYADEALFEAGLHPARKTSGLHRAEKERLFEAIRTVLERGIQSGGTSFRDFVNSDGEKGTNQEKLYVYGREGEPCLKCGTPIVKTVISQRGTHYCPKCQPRRR
jgi:formamidopyrimidine-DNA glycosylase